MATRKLSGAGTGRLGGEAGSGVVTPVTGWGRSSTVAAEELRSEDLEGISREAVLTRGLGRSYGDASLPPREGARVVASPLANRILDFDAKTGVLRAEAGLALADLNRVLLRRGWLARYHDFEE